MYCTVQCLGKVYVQYHKLEVRMYNVSDVMTQPYVAACVYVSLLDVDMAQGPLLLDNHDASPVRKNDD